MSSRKNVPLGQTVITPGAFAALDESDLRNAISRHVRGDWGEVDPDDWAENELSYEKGFRILSVYNASNGTRFWIITEADRSVTTVLLPEEY